MSKNQSRKEVRRLLNENRRLKKFVTPIEEGLYIAPGKMVPSGLYTATMYAGVLLYIALVTLLAIGR